MAFPDNVDTLTQAVDPSTTTDMNNINYYQSLMTDGLFTQASDFLATMLNGIEMNMSAGRFNEVVSTLLAIETFYLQLNGVKDYIRENIDKYMDINAWSNLIDYSVGNISANGGSWYVCTQINGPATTIYEPNVTSGWESYWDLFLTPQEPIQYPIKVEQPTGQAVGDLWFRIIE